jgi:hypothetical protein
VYSQHFSAFKVLSSDFSEFRFSRAFPLLVLFYIKAHDLFMLKRKYANQRRVHFIILIKKDYKGLEANKEVPYGKQTEVCCRKIK